MAQLQELAFLPRQPNSAYLVPAVLARISFQSDFAESQGTVRCSPRSRWRLKTRNDARAHTADSNIATRGLAHITPLSHGFSAAPQEAYGKFFRSVEIVSITLLVSTHYRLRPIHRAFVRVNSLRWVQTDICGRPFPICSAGFLKFQDTGRSCAELPHRLLFYQPPTRSACLSKRSFETSGPSDVLSSRSVT